MNHHFHGIANFAFSCFKCYQTLAEFLLPAKITPLGFTITNDFSSSLTDRERLFLDDRTSGYSLKDISKYICNIPTIRQFLQDKAAACF